MKDPKISEKAFVAKNATVIGDVTVEEDANIWFGAAIRGDMDSIYIGKGSNVQDNAVVHVDKGFPVKIGENVTIGHGAIVHGCTVGNNVLVGMGAIILNGAKIGDNCIIGAGAMVTQNKEIPANSLLMGCPAKVVREVDEQGAESTRQNSLRYIEEGKEYKKLGY